MGYGMGSLVFSLIINIGLNQTLRIFGGVAIVAACIAQYTFRMEQ
jgi:uncharacterized protein YjeT (DUF2065 family)